MSPPSDSDADPRQDLDADSEPKPRSKKGASAEEPPEEREVLSRGEVRIEGDVISYTASAATLHLRDEDGKPKASIFHVSYVKEGVEDRSSRPITFAFNGGPGSSSVWLHLGALGPRRIELPDASRPPPPPYRQVENEHSILDLTDLVFIDPVGTGHSRPLGEVKGSDYHGVQEDVDSMAEFIRLYLSRHGRWNSPRFLAGESYGTTRSAALVAKLHEEGIVCSGVLLLSAALNFQTFIFEAGNDLPHILYLPSYAATAWLHHALEERPAELGQLLEEVKEFAIGEYAHALFQGSKLGAKEREAVVARLSRYTGLSRTWLERADLRIEIGRFARELLRDRGITVGRLDSRYTGMEPDAVGESLQDDPSFSGPMGPFTAVMNDYLAGELGFVEQGRYEVLSMKVNEGWRWSEERRLGYVNTTAALRRTMLSNPHLKVFFANGIYDLATPFFASEHTASHLGAEAHIRANIVEAFYEAGHMMYLHPPSRAKLRQDMAAFYGAALG
ncbi:MAG: hypothetical protein OEY14_05115 [Myxococcales bacterium]|nr:hypothetical protein [Myxococcales bacterium]